MTLPTSPTSADSSAREQASERPRFFGRPPLAWLTPAIAAVWLVGMTAATLWTWGLNPQALLSPDEALNRFAAEVLSRTGRPFLSLPFADPEDLAHPRHWVTLDRYAVPAYAPLAIYVYALLLRLGAFGWFAVAALPASAAAAFAAGVAQLLPAPRRWLALPAPLLAFPAVYWLMRPWMNVSALLVCVCWAVHFWARWLRRDSARDLAIAVGAVGAAAAVRPDFAAYLMLLTLVLGAAARPASWRRVLVLVLLAGSGAVAINLFLNWLVTGRPLLAAYQIVVARDESGGSEGPGGVVGLLRQLLIPLGVPPAQKAAHFIGKYWLEMGGIAGLTLGQVALVPLLRARSKLVRALHLLALVVMLCFMLSHMDPGLAGASEALGLVHHSMPRYYSPLYLLAVLPPILFLGTCQRRWLFAAGSAAVVVLAAAGAYEITAREVFSLAGMRRFERESAEAVRSLKSRVPERAMVYSAAYDKILWPHWRVGTVDAPEQTAASMLRATQAGIEVFVYEPNFKRPQQRKLDRALSRRGLDLSRLGPRGLYRVTPEGGG